MTALALPGMDAGMVSRATISGDRLYRYTLDRIWSRTLPVLRICMLNPSTADMVDDDRTVEGLIRKARNLRCGAIRIVNIFAFRSRNPHELLAIEDPIGPRNDQVLREEAAKAGPIVVGWGAPTGLAALRKLVRLRALRVVRIFGDVQLQAFGVTKDGEPRHPLFVRDDARLIPWPEEG